MKKSFRFLAIVMVVFMVLPTFACNLNKSSGEIRFSDNTIGSIMQVMYNAIGKDQATAEQMIGEFFGVELEDRLGDRMTDERGDIVSKMHVYTDIFAKDSVRFNGMQIWTDDNDGHVRRIELTLCNTGYTTVPIEDTPEFQSEIISLFNDADGELQKSFGQPREAGASMWDEDSFWARYEISSDRYIYVENLNYTEPGGNGLVSTQIIFADAELLSH